MISIDVTALKDEIGDLQEFLKSKTGVTLKSDGRVISVGSGEDKLSRGDVKDFVQRFFHRKGLSETYLVRIEKDSIKIVKKKD